MNFWEKLKEQWQSTNKVMLLISAVGGFIFDGAVQEFHAAPVVQVFLVGLGTVVIYKIISRDLPKKS